MSFIRCLFVYFCACPCVCVVACRSCVCCIRFSKLPLTLNFWISEFFVKRKRLKLNSIKQKIVENWFRSEHELHAKCVETMNRVCISFKSAYKWMNNENRMWITLDLWYFKMLFVAVKGTTNGAHVRSKNEEWADTSAVYRVELGEREKNICCEVQWTQNMPSKVLYLPCIEQIILFFGFFSFPHIRQCIGVCSRHILVANCRLISIGTSQWNALLFGRNVNGSKGRFSGVFFSVFGFVLCGM